MGLRANASDAAGGASASKTATMNRIKEIQTAIANGADKNQFEAELTELQDKYKGANDILQLIRQLMQQG